MTLNGVNVVVQPDYRTKCAHFVKSKRKWGPRMDKVWRYGCGNALRDGEIWGDSKTAVMNPRTYSALRAEIDRYGQEVVEP